MNPQYSTIFFILLAVLLIVTLCVFVITNKKNLRKYQKSNEELIAENQKLLTQIQDLQSSESVLRTTNYTRTKVMSIISHNVKGPLKYLNYVSTFLEKNWDTLDYDELRKSSKAIQETSKSLYDLVENILQWSKQQSGGIRFMPEKIRLKQLIEEEIDIQKPLFLEKSLSTSNTIDAKLRINADAHQLRLMIQNVLSNAIKFSNPQGTITFRAMRKNGETILSIQDEGVGMSKREIERIFDINDHYTRPGTEDERGNGIGLLIIQDLMSFHGGKVEFSSMPNRGTTVHLIFPDQIANEHPLMTSNVEVSNTQV